MQMSKSLSSHGLDERVAGEMADLVHEETARLRGMQAPPSDLLRRWNELRLLLQGAASNERGEFAFRFTETARLRQSGEGAVTRVVLVENHKSVRDGLRAVLEGHPWIRVVGEAECQNQALSVTQATEADVVVMDVSIPWLDGIEAARCLAVHHPLTKIIALSPHADRHHIVEMLSAGAAGYLLKNTADDELIHAIEAAVAGRTYLSREIAGAVAETLREPIYANVSSSGEREVPIGGAAGPGAPLFSRARS